MRCGTTTRQACYEKTSPCSEHWHGALAALRCFFGAMCCDAVLFGAPSLLHAAPCCFSLSFAALSVRCGAPRCSTVFFAAFRCAVKIDALRARFRLPNAKPSPLERICTTCGLNGRKVPATFVITGADGLQWFECSDHTDADGSRPGREYKCETLDSWTERAGLPRFTHESFGAKIDRLGYGPRSPSPPGSRVLAPTVLGNSLLLWFLDTREFNITIFSNVSDIERHGAHRGPAINIRLRQELGAMVSDSITSSPFTVQTVVTGWVVFEPKTGDILAYNVFPQFHWITVLAGDCITINDLSIRA